ncbi:MAG: hypothetical protein J7L96_00290 [Bacteroidales bacterium]|nr:hypothetical protein [Bacteroidales bacterium]
MKTIRGLLLGILIFSMGCEKNQAPVIEGLEYSSSDLKPGAIFTLSVTAYDSDGDSLNYEWQANGGDFLESINKPQTLWKSPTAGAGKSYSLTVTVSDDEYSVIDSCQISLRKNNPPKILEIRTIPTTDCGGSTFTLVVTANDPDGDPMSYQWLCQNGTFLEYSNQAMVRWVAPHSHMEENYSFEIHVSDKHDSVSSEISLIVTKSPGGTLEGFISFAGTLIPVSEVSLSLATRFLLSDTLGLFTFSEIPFGSYSLECTKSGFEVLIKEVAIEPDKLTTVELSMVSGEHTSKVYGIVRDQYGNNLEDAYVTLHNPDGTESEISTSTNFSGYYELFKIPHGLRKIVITKSPDDINKYIEYVSNSYIKGAESEVNIEMQSISILPIVFSDSVAELSYHFVRGYGRVEYNGDSEMFEQGYCWSTNPNPTVMDSHSVATSSLSNFEVEVLYLNANTNYYLRAYMTNSYQKTGYGDQVEIRTKAYGLLTDTRDGKEYKTIIIGDQEWMAESLKFATASHSWCYDDNTSNCLDYGRLYNWQTAKAYLGQGHGICPPGWRLPSDAEWKTLELNIGVPSDEIDNAQYRGGSQQVAKILKATDGWQVGHNGINSIGFNAFPGGSRNGNGEYSKQGYSITFWTATSNSATRAIIRLLSVENEGIYRGYSDIDHGHYVRCLKE